MTARDRWTVDLKCTPCGVEGVAEVSQADGWAFNNDQSTSVDHLPSGFRSQRVEGGHVEFYCSTCGAKA